MNYLHISLQFIAMMGNSKDIELMRRSLIWGLDGPR